MPDAKANAGSTDVVAAFDFDGTLTTSDSFMRFLAWRRPRAQFAADLALTAPLLLLYGARLVGNEAHKMALFARQFAGMPVDAFREQAREFSRLRIPTLVRPEALLRLRYHLGQGHRVVIVTASLVDWITPWAQTVGAPQVLGSAAEVRDGRLTGRLDGPNCHGPEKLRRLLAVYPGRATYRLHAYGDGRGDRELLAAADDPYYRRFA